MVNKGSVIKYAAVASAVGLACGGAASAASLSTTGTLSQFSRNAIVASSSGTDVTMPIGAFTVTLGATYAANDQVTIAISGGSFRTSTNTGNPASVVSCGPAGGVAGTAGGSALLLGFLSKDSSTATFRVTNVASGATTNGAQCAFDAAGFSVVASSIGSAGASGVTLSFYANAGGAAGTRFDASTNDLGATPNAFAVAGTAVQYRAAAGSNFSGVVDVSTGRRAWAEGNSKTLTLSLTSLNLTSPATASQTTAVANIYGAAGTQMFSFLNDGTGTCTADELTAGAGSASVSSGSLSISSDCATLTWTSASGYSVLTANATPGGPTITLSKATSSTGLQIPDGVFTVGVAFTTTISGSTTQSITAFSGGEFTINGTTITVPYMPYGTSGTSAITQSYYIANSSTTAGTVTGVAQNQAGVTCQLGTIGTAAAKSVTNLSSAINDKIAACYATAGVYPDGTRVYLELTSNTSASKTVLNTTYNVGGNSRVNVTNNSNRVRTDN